MKFQPNQMLQTIGKDSEKREHVSNIVMSLRNMEKEKESAAMFSQKRKKIHAPKPQPTIIQNHLISFITSAR